MSVTSELDAWCAALEAATGIRVTRDPSVAVPPCILVELPAATAGPATNLHLELPLVMLGPGGPKDAADWLLDHLEVVLDATGQVTADTGAYTLDETTFLAYRITVPIRTEE